MLIKITFSFNLYSKLVRKMLVLGTELWTSEVCANVNGSVCCFSLNSSQYPCSSPRCVGIYKWNTSTQSTRAGFVTNWSMLKMKEADHETSKILKQQPCCQHLNVRILNYTHLQTVRGKKSLNAKQIGKSLQIVYSHWQIFSVPLPLLVQCTGWSECWSSHTEWVD